MTFQQPRQVTVVPRPLNAVEKLRRIKEHQTSFLREIADNWAGWLFSALLHVTVIVLLVVLVVTVVQQEKEYTLDTGYDNSLRQLMDPSLDDVIKRSPVDADIDQLPSVDANRQDTTPGYTEMDPGAPDYLTLGGNLTGLGQGGGGGEGLAGKTWGGYISDLRTRGLDVVFVFDSTGSMGGIILETKTRIRQLMKVVTYLVPDARLGLVTYRDKKEYDLDDYEYTTKAWPLTRDIKALEKFLRETEAYGGGDIPEAIMDALDVAMTRMGWNQGSRQVIVIFGDAPPRPENDGLKKVYAQIENWHKRTGGIISCIDTTGGSRLMEEFQEMAKAGAGDATFLNNERDIIRQLVVYIFGSEWRKEIDRVYNAVLKGPEDVTIIGGEPQGQ